MDCLAALPGAYLGTETLVGEATGRVGEGLRGCLEVHEACGGGTRVSAIGACLVWMVDGREPAEAGLDYADGGTRGDIEVGVESPLQAEGTVGLDKGVEEVEGDDEDVDSAAMGSVFRGAGLRLGVASADS